MKRKELEKGKAWLKKETRVYVSPVLFLTVLTAFTTLFSLAFAYMTRYLINSASDKNGRLFWVFAIVLLTVLLLKIVCKALDGYYSERLRSKVYTEIRQKSFQKILRSEYAGVQKYHSGELMTRLTADTQEIAIDTVGFLPAVVGMAFQLFGAIVALFTIDPLFTAIYVVCGIVLGGLTVLFRKRIKKLHKDVLSADGKARSFMQESITSSMTVKAYGAEDKTAEKAKGFSTDYYRKRLSRNFLRTEMNFIISLLSNCGLIFAVVWCGVSLLNGNGANDYGKILSVVLLLMQLQQPLTSFSSVLPVYYARIASAERLAELDEIPLEETGKVGVDAYKNLRAFVLDGVSFTYGRDTVFQNASARIHKGETVCITGLSGSGKSTLFKLLLGVYKPTEGELSLEGDFGRIALDASARDLFAYVPQGNFLFSGTIYENLTFFADKENLSEEKIRNLISCACADFVYELPDGIHTLLAENGDGLSEGQKQRLAVARALLSDRPVLLFDEATSALDAETERILIQNVKALKDKTCLIVTHRPMALGIADKVLSVDGGEIKAV